MKPQQETVPQKYQRICGLNDDELKVEFCTMHSKCINLLEALEVIATKNNNFRVLSFIYETCARIYRRANDMNSYDYYTQLANLNFALTQFQIGIMNRTVGVEPTQPPITLPQKRIMKRPVSVGAQQPEIPRPRSATTGVTTIGFFSGNPGSSLSAVPVTVTRVVQYNPYAAVVFQPGSLTPR